MEVQSGSKSHDLVRGWGVEGAGGCHIIGAIVFDTVDSGQWRADLS